MKKFVNKFKSDGQPQYAPPPGPPPGQGQSSSYGGVGGGPPAIPGGRPGGGYAPPSGPPPPSSGGYGGPPQSAGGAGYAPQHQGQAQAPAMMAGAGGEDPLSALRKYDTVVLVDDSGSMEMYWDETREALQGVVSSAIRYDSDGIDIYWFNDPLISRNVNSVQEVARIFRRIDPRKSTPTARALTRVLGPYLESLERAKAAGPGGEKVKPMNLIVLTDGAPDRDQDPEEVLADAGRRLDAMRQPLFQLGINFIQIGNDEEAAAHLAHLDDDLKAKHRIRDFVDTTPFAASHGGRVTADFILKSLLGGINRRVDKEGAPPPTH